MGDDRNDPAGLRLQIAAVLWRWTRPALAHTRFSWENGRRGEASPTPNAGISSRIGSEARLDVVGDGQPPARHGQIVRTANPDFSPMSLPASRPDVRSARSGPKSVAQATVEACDAAAGGRLGATRRAAALRPTGCVEALVRCPTSPCAPLLPSRPESAAQTMTLERNPG